MQFCRNLSFHCSFSRMSLFLVFVNLQRQYNVKKFLVSTDKKFVLLTHDVKRVSRTTSILQYLYIFDDIKGRDKSFLTQSFTFCHFFLPSCLFHCTLPSGSSLLSNCKVQNIQRLKRTCFPIGDIRRAGDTICCLWTERKSTRKYSLLFIDSSSARTSCLRHFFFLAFAVALVVNLFHVQSHVLPYFLFFLTRLISLNIHDQKVFVQGNNIYYLPSVGESVRQLTRTGQDGSVWNGVPDWIYGEKILRTDHAVWFSPDGSRLAYVSFDDSKVASIAYPKYGSYDDPNNVFPEVTSLRYPKAGRVNPEVALWVVDLPSGNTRKLTPPSEIVDR